MEVKKKSLLNDEHSILFNNNFDGEKVETISVIKILK